MKRERYLNTLLSIIFIMLFFIMLIIFIIRGVMMGRFMLEERLRLKADERLEDYCERLKERIDQDVKAKALELYGSIEVKTEENQAEAEAKAETEFMNLYEDYITRTFSAPYDVLLKYSMILNEEDSRIVSIKKASMKGREGIRISGDQKPRLYKSYDKDGKLDKCFIKNICLENRRGNELVDKISFEIALPDPVPRFYSGNDLLFDFSMAAQKGIYITGNTTSVLGNIYAGTHEASEVRQAELSYGETDSFGGINILSTQLGVDAKTLISEGDINVKGSFVIFGLDNTETTIYAGAINKIEGIGSFREVNITGEYKTETSRKKYEDLLSSIKLSMKKLGDLSDYYDSDNDPSYKGKYRKLLSKYDITLSQDFSGIIASAGSVIVESGVNVEGIILSADRIYVRGDNLIVSDSGILRAILDEEISRQEEEAMKKESDEYYISHEMCDYIENIRYKGLYYD